MSATHTATKAHNKLLWWSIFWHPSCSGSKALDQCAICRGQIRPDGPLFGGSHPLFMKGGAAYKSSAPFIAINHRTKWVLHPPWKQPSNESYQTINTLTAWRHKITADAIQNVNFHFKNQLVRLSAIGTSKQSSNYPNNFSKGSSSCFIAVIHDDNMSCQALEHENSFPSKFVKLHF